MADIIQIRRDTAANWTAANPVLAQGEFGVETDTLKLKIGDGASPWTGLRYYHSGSPYEAGEGISINDFTINNTGIITIGTGGTNGTIKANGQDVAVKGLGSAAYVDTTTLPNKDLDNLSTTGKANISAQGTFDGTVNYSVGTVGRRLASRASRDMTDLTATGKNIGNWSSNVTNCITEIPQDIKLELNSGTLTLKAGSKMCVPNGSGVFNTYTTSNDISSTFITNGTHLVGYAPSFGTITTYLNAVSGGTEPTTLTNGLTWYDTTNNVIKRAWAGAWQNSLFSLPICIVTVSGGQITSIDQVFNGFGYIGSTVFALPGVKGLIPNGRNADGTLNNILTTVTTVRTSTAVSGNTGRKTMTINNTGYVDRPGGLEYNERENRNYNFGSLAIQCICGYFTVGSDYKITDFVVKTAFHAVDYSDSEYIANCAMPSDKYVGMATPTQTTNYTAPADGYVAVAITLQSGASCALFDRYAFMGQVAFGNSSNEYHRLFLPIRKGATYTIQLSGTFSIMFHRFEYANGAK